MMSADNPLLKLMQKHQRGERSTFQIMPYLSIARMAERGLKFTDVLRDPSAMAEAALMNFEFGFESTVLPYDLNVEAEMLGAHVNFFKDVEGYPVYPTIGLKPVARAADIAIPDDLAGKGRMPEILKSVEMVIKSAVGKGAVGAFVPGPFTFAQQVMDIDELFLMVIENPEEAKAIFEGLAVFINKLKEVYTDAGVDFIVIEDGGATTISPHTFEELLLPHLKDIFKHKEVPQVLSLTGGSDSFIQFMLKCRPDGIGVDQQCDIVRARELVPQAIPLFAICGALDMLARADDEAITHEVNNCLGEGAMAVGPPADIYPMAKIENIEVFVRALREYRG